MGHEVRHVRSCDSIRPNALATRHRISEEGERNRLPSGEYARIWGLQARRRFQNYSGKTIEVFSTDAEGRNVLADGLWKAGELDPEYIVDLATLTGAVVVALGNQISGMWANDEGIAKRLKAAAKRSGSLSGGCLLTLSSAST